MRETRIHVKYTVIYLAAAYPRRVVESSRGPVKADFLSGFNCVVRDYDDDDPPDARPARLCTGDDQQ